MDAERFDALTRRLGRGASRRSVLKGLAAGALGVLGARRWPATAQTGAGCPTTGGSAGATFCGQPCTTEADCGGYFDACEYCDLNAPSGGEPGTCASLCGACGYCASGTCWNNCPACFLCDHTTGVCEGGCGECEVCDDTVGLPGYVWGQCVPAACPPGQGCDPVSGACAPGAAPCRTAGAACTADLECCGGLVCDLASQTCAAPGGGPCAGEGESCASSEECCGTQICSPAGGQGPVCVRRAGRCLTPPSCATSGDCCGGEVCVDGACVPAGRRPA